MRMKKMFFSWMPAAVLIVLLLQLVSVTAFAENSINYIGENGNAKVCENYTLVTENDTTWTEGWYVVEGTITINNTVACSGAVNLILKDGCELRVTGGDKAAGINVTGNNRLNIYAQSGKTGKLIAIGGDYMGEGGAGIGGSAEQSGGNIYIYGGNITAKGGTSSAGIGGGLHGFGRYIYIYGGKVTAYGGDYGAGIGGGYAKENENLYGEYFANPEDAPRHIILNYKNLVEDLTISGGEVKAKGGNYGAGIGGGRYGWVSNITIDKGAKVTATGGMKGAGIGSGSNGKVRWIKINDSSTVINATGGSNGAGIGSGMYEEASGITISGGTITANGSGGGAGIGGGSQGSLSGLEIKGGTVKAIGGTNEDYSKGGAGIGGGAGKYGKNISVGGSNIKVEAFGGLNAAGIGGGTGGYGRNFTFHSGTIHAEGNSAPGIHADGSTYVNTNMTIHFSQTGDLTGGNGLAEDMSGLFYKYNVADLYEETISYIDASGTKLKTVAAPITKFSVESKNYTLQTGTYYVDSTLNLTNGLNISGNVIFILCDGCDLNINVADKKNVAGIRVSGYTNSLTIYGQTANSGMLEAYGGEFAAGIGGGKKFDNGENVTINGGTIIAKGGPGDWFWGSRSGSTAAGIGGGGHALGSNIRINGGDVTAIAGSYDGHAIGCGSKDRDRDDTPYSWNLFVNENLFITKGETTEICGYHKSDDDLVNDKTFINASELHIRPCAVSVNKNNKGSVTYNDFNTAWKEAISGSDTYIKLWKDFSVSELVIPAGKTVHIKLNGHKLTRSSDGYTVKVKGKLILSDRRGGGHLLGGIYVYQGGKFEYQSGSYDTLTYEPAVKTSRAAGQIDSSSMVIDVSPTPNEDETVNQPADVPGAQQDGESENTASVFSTASMPIIIGGCVALIIAIGAAAIASKKKKNQL